MNIKIESTYITQQEDSNDIINRLILNRQEIWACSIYLWDKNGFYTYMCVGIQLYIYICI
jgi:hypothetical protein